MQPSIRWDNGGVHNEGLVEASQCRATAGRGQAVMTPCVAAGCLTTVESDNSDDRKGNFHETS